MNKRFIPFLMLAVVLMMAPSAFAGHCWKCSLSNPSLCVEVAPGKTGATFCEDGQNGEPCIYWGDWCTGGHLAAAMAPLSAEFQVASVERLDDAQPSANETRVASAELPRPAATH